LPVTIHDVARRAGVSESTVSRSFTVPELVRPETREAVRAAAALLGYRPNRAARSLITGKTGNLGIIVPDLGNPFFPSVVKGAQARAREADHAIFLADSDEDPLLESELIRAMAKQVDGVILCSSRTTTADLQQLAQLTKLVLLNRRYVGLPAVLMDSAGGMRQAVQHLAALGHQRCAFLSGPRTSWSNKERRRGLSLAARSSGVDMVELGPFAPTFDAGQQAADVALAAGVSGIVAFNDLMALGVISRLNDRSVAIPAEMSVVGFDDIAMAAMCTPSLTTVAMPTESAGRAGVDLLLQRLAPGEPGAAVASAQRRLPAQLIVRGSTAPPLHAARSAARRSPSHGGRRSTGYPASAGSPAASAASAAPAASAASVAQEGTRA
jgi:DNA-binding LacI/PurR family transcriptional regulator